MQAVMAVEAGKLGMGELPIPTPGEFEALVRMEACAICNSTDHKLLDGEFCGGAFPIVLGHEVISTVTQIGPGVKNFAPGDRVFRQRLCDGHVPGPGRSCWGGMAQWGIVRDEWAAQGKPYGPEHLPHDQQKLLIDVSAPQAAAMVTLMETLDCIATCGAAPGKSVAIVGSGPVGQALAMFARLLGASPVWAFGRRDAYAQRFADVAKVDGYVSAAQVPAEVEKIVRAGGFDVVVEAVGSPEALDRCIALVGPRGKVCVYGVAPASKAYRADQTGRENVGFVGACEGRAQAQLVRFVESGAVRLDDWISHVLSLEQFQKGFDLIDAREATKVVLTAEG